MSDEYEIRAEEDGFSVYKNGKFVKSFPTLKEAEDFKRLKEKKEDEKEERKMKYTIQKENGVYVVYKDGSPDKSFPTLEEAEKYIKSKQRGPIR